MSVDCFFIIIQYVFLLFYNIKFNTPLESFLNSSDADEMAALDATAYVETNLLGVVFTKIRSWREGRTKQTSLDFTLVA